MKTTNIEIYNFLNLTNHRLGKLYKYSGYCPLPNDFVVTKQKIKERLILSQMKSDEIFPPFCCDEKRKIKKFFKNCLKNCKKMKKTHFSNLFSAEFAEKLDIYFDMEVELLEMLLKEFKNHTFDEVAAYRDIYNVDPVLSQILQHLFDNNFNLNENLSNLEEKYKLSYSEKLKLLEIEQEKIQKNKKKIENNLQNLKNTEKITENSKKIIKKTDKIAETNLKAENKAQVRKVKQEIKNSKIKEQK